jgi:outer membrane protein TolC
MERNKILFTIALLVTGTALAAQEGKQVFGPEAVMNMVRKNHPVAKQAALLVNKADAELLSARGAFDPAFELDASRKTFDGKNYYYYSNPQLQIPTAAAVALKAGTESNGGDLLSPEITRGRSSYLGVELPLGNGLLLDKRRAALQQAKILQNQSEQERRNVLNNLLLDAYDAYWQWAGAHQLYAIYSGFLANALQRQNLVRNAYINGDRSVMDTVESYTQLQQYHLQQAEAKQKLNNAAISLSYFLWQDDTTAYQLPEHYVPDTTRFNTREEDPVSEENMALILAQHPLLRSAGYKVSSMETEKRLKLQGLLPYVSLKANVLSKEYGFVKGLDAAYLQNNYKWGVSVQLPLFLRQGRGEYKKAQIKLKETQLELSAKRRQLENKIRYYQNERTRLLEQLELTRSLQNNYRQLLRNEELKFMQGESSLFLVNSRENKLLEILQKQTQLRIKYLTAGYELRWAGGLLD